nr:hypothetical protein [Streptomyces sp. DSM 41633]
DGPRKEYYEIKPLSISGAAAGVLKLVFIVKFMSDLGLPYQRGMSYPNTANGAKDIPIMGGTVLGSQLDVILNVTRHAPGILTYSICLHGDLTALLAKVGLAALLAMIAAQLFVIAGGGAVVAV